MNADPHRKLALAIRIMTSLGMTPTEIRKTLGATK